MPARDVYIVAWDVVDNSRRARVRKAVTAFGVDGQRSVRECRLTKAERSELERRLAGMMNRDEDRLLIIRIADPEATEALGQATTPRKDPFLYFG